MAAADTHVPYPRRRGESHTAMASSKLLALLLLSAPIARSFLTPSPSFLAHQHHAPSSSASSSAPHAAASLALSSIPSRRTRQASIFCGRRGRRTGLRISGSDQWLNGLSAKSDDNNDNDSDGDGESSSENKMPSDDALFRDSIGSPDDTDDTELTLSDSSLVYDDDDDGDDESYTDTDPYAQTAPSEFSENSDEESQPPESLSALSRQARELNTTPLDWGGELSTLRSRVSDIESGKSTNPSTALFRTISRERPNEAIGRFVREANPEVVAAMTGAVSSLLGSLSNPAMGVEMIVQASSEKLGNLCFQLMMTGYMFRNAEYVLALKSLMDINGDGTTLEDYRAAFQRIDTDGSGFLEREEIEAMLADVYGGQAPAFEVSTFLEFFDSNNDGRISWQEFEEGFGVVTKMAGGDASGLEEKMKKGFTLPGSNEEDEENLFSEPSVSGTIQVELEDGKIIEVDAQEYMNDLKQQALALKRELAQEKGLDPKDIGLPESGAAADAFVNQAVPGPGSSGGIASYIASLEGDVKSLTQGISPEVVDSMKMLIEFVIEGGEGGPEGVGNAKSKDKKKEMELPGSALQQLALWQLVSGYRLRETEATGEWRQMLE